MLRLVETATGRTVARLEGTELRDAWPTFSPDGSRLVVTTNFGPAVHVWDLRTIRKQLVVMGLDWDAPPIPEHDVAARSAPEIRQVEVRDLETQIARAESLAFQGQWNQAAAAYAEGFGFRPSERPDRWFERAILALAVGDTSEYRLSCQHMLDEMHASARGSDDDAHGSSTARTPALSPPMRQSNLRRNYHWPRDAPT